MATFLWALQWGGLSIALLGLLREQLLSQRLAQRLTLPCLDRPIRHNAAGCGEPQRCAPPLL